MTLVFILFVPNDLIWHTKEVLARRAKAFARTLPDGRAFQRHPDESARMMKIPYVAMRLIAWAGVIGLAVASGTPGQEMVRTGFNTRLEHTKAYLMAGIAVLAAYPQKPPWLIAVLLGV